MALTPSPGVALVIHANAPMLPLVLLHLGRRWTARRRLIGYWAWELPSIPGDWRPGAGCVHEAWAPSRFTAQALEALLPGRVRVVPHAIATNPPRPAALGREAFGLPAHAVVVLVSFNLASSFERKNPLGAIAAFRAAFGDRSDRLLVLKVTHVDHAPADFARLRDAAAGSANIRFETRIMPAAESHALTVASDIVLSLHRSEGFGLVPAEAMLLARPVIATGWSGNMDYMDDSCAALVDVDLVPARDPRRVYDVPGAVWAEPHIGEAVAHLRRLADDAEARTALGQRGRAMANSRLGAAGLEAALRDVGILSGAASCRASSP
jgi:glycosyltransferase involved in cell wall biosynthesis